MPITRQTRNSTQRNPRTNTRAARNTRANAPANRTTRNARASNRPTTRRGNTSYEADLPNERQVEELLLQALETELGGVQVYETAVRCASNPELREEWQTYLEQTRHHVEVVETLCGKLGIDTERETPGRAIVRTLGESFVTAMQTALKEAPGEGAQLVAAECVTLAETKDHQNWTLIGELCDAYDAAGDEERCAAFEEAYDEVEDEEDEHLYHTMGWCRELWIESLGMPAAIPPPEETKDVKSMAQAAKAKGGRKRYAKKSR